VYLYCGNDPLNAADPYGLDWDWAKYFRDVGNVFVGYGQAIWGVISSPYTIGKYYWENGVSWESTKQLVGGMWSGFCGDWQAAWEGDAQAFGRAFGGVLIAVGTAAAPFAKGGTAAGSGSGVLRATGQTVELSNPAHLPMYPSGTSMSLGSVNPCGSKPPNLNLPATIRGRYYSGHALDAMQARGITPSVIEDTIRCGQRTQSGNKIVYYSKVNDLTVVTNKHGGVVTTYRGRPGGRKIQ
jgi:filamentous hemagglutinin